MSNCNGCPFYRECDKDDKEDIRTKVIKIKSLGNRDNKYMTIRRSQNDK